MPRRSTAGLSRLTVISCWPGGDRCVGANPAKCGQSVSPTINGASGKVRLAYATNSYAGLLRRDSGCLRIIPGSHRSNLHEMLKPHQPPENDLDSAMFGLIGSEVPAHAFESDPGDLIIFSKCLWHAAFGSEDTRRMVSFSFAPHRPTPDNIQYFRHFFQRDEEVTPSQPSPAEVLRRSGRERMAGIIGRLSSLGLHSPVW